MQKVLQNLLRERVSIRDMEAIMEAMCDRAGSTENADLLTEHVRSRTVPHAHTAVLLLGRPGVVRESGGVAGGYRRHVRKRRARGCAVGRSAAAACGQGSRGNRQRAFAAQRQGKPPVLLCSPPVRPALRQLVAARMPEAAVLGYNEIDSAQVQSIASIGIEQ